MKFVTPLRHASSIIEAAYNLGDPLGPWLQRLLRAMAADLDGGFGLYALVLDFERETFRSLRRLCSIVSASSTRDRRPTSTRFGTKCTEQQGSIEGTGCAKAGAAICNLPPNGGTGTAGAQHYYGTTDADELEALKSTCERTGGTFAPPS